MKSSGTLENCSFGIGKKGTIFIDSIDITVLQSVLFLRMAQIFRHIKLLRRFLVAKSQKFRKRQFQIQILSALLCFRGSLLIVVNTNIFKNDNFFHNNWEKRAMLWIFKNFSGYFEYLMIIYIITRLVLHYNKFLIELILFLD